MKYCNEDHDHRHYKCIAPPSSFDTMWLDALKHLIVRTNVEPTSPNKGDYPELTDAILEAEREAKKREQ